MEDQKIYWSNTPSEKWGDADFLTFFLIPNKWWSIEAWKYAFSMRAAMLRKSVMTLDRDTPPLRHGERGKMNPWEWRCEQETDCICGNDCDLEEFRERMEEDDYGGDNCTYGDDE